MSQCALRYRTGQRSLRLCGGNPSIRVWQANIQSVESAGFPQCRVGSVDERGRLKFHKGTGFSRHCEPV